MCIMDKFFLFIVPLTGTIRVVLFSCLLPGSTQWKCVLSEPLCAYRTRWHWWISRCGCEPERPWASWASSYSSETSSTFQGCKWRRSSYSSEKQEQLCAWSAFSLICTFLECCLKWPTAECKNESRSFLCQRNPKSSVTAGLNIYWRNRGTKLN